MTFLEKVTKNPEINQIASLIMELETSITPLSDYKQELLTKSKERLAQLIAENT